MWGAEIWFLVVGAVLLMAATVIEAKNSYSHKLLLFSAYVLPLPHWFSFSSMRSSSMRLFSALIDGGGPPGLSDRPRWPPQARLLP